MAVSKSSTPATSGKPSTNWGSKPSTPSTPSAPSKPPTSSGGSSSPNPFNQTSPAQTYFGTPTKTSPSGTYITPTGSVSYQSQNPLALAFKSSGGGGGRSSSSSVGTVTQVQGGTVTQTATGGVSTPTNKVAQLVAPPQNPLTKAIDDRKQYKVQTENYTNRQRSDVDTTRSIGLVSNQDKTLKSVWIGSGLPTMEKVSQTWEIFTGNKGSNYAQAQQEADFLARGKQTQFGGKSFFDLNPVERRGTAQISSVPFTDKEVVSMIDFTGGAGIILGQRQQREYDILGISTSQSLEPSLRSKYQSQVTPGMSEAELEKINTAFTNEFKTQFDIQTKPKVEALQSKYKGLYSNLQTTQIERSVLGALPATTVVGLGFATLPASIASTAGIVLGGATVVSTLRSQDSFKYVYEPSKIEGKPGAVSQQFTTAGTLNLAMGGLTIGLGAFGKIRGIETDMLKLETARLMEQNKIVQPYFEQRFTTPNIDVGFTKAKVGSMKMGEAQTNMFTSSITKKSWNSFEFSQASTSLTRAELSWNYPQGNKLVMLQQSGFTGKGMMLPSAVEGKGFSVFEVQPKYNVGTSAIFKDFSTLPKSFKSNLQGLPLEGNKFYLGESTKLTDNIFLGKSFELSKLNLDFRSGNLNWMALTKGTSSRGFTKINKKPSSGIGDFTYNPPKGTKSSFSPEVKGLDIAPTRVIPTIDKSFSSPQIMETQSAPVTIAKQDYGVNLGQLMKTETIMPKIDVGRRMGFVGIGTSQNKRVSTLYSPSTSGLTGLSGIQMSAPKLDLRISTSVASATKQDFALQQETLLLPVSTTTITPGMGNPPRSTPFGGFEPFVLPGLPSLGGYAIGNPKKRKRVNFNFDIAPSFTGIVTGIRLKAPLKVSRTFGVSPTQFRGLPAQTKKGKKKKAYFKYTDL